VLSETSGMVDLDTDGDGLADDQTTLAALGITDDERVEIFIVSSEKLSC
jgi:hypothetical protein